MAINFPDVPTTGQTFTVGSQTWTYDGAKWVGAATSVPSLSGGVQGSVPYQSAVGTTAMLSPGTSGQVLTTNGSGANPTWSNADSMPQIFMMMGA